MRTALAAGILAAALAAHVSPAPAADEQQKLERARTRIGELERRQAADLERRGRAFKELRDAERQAARAATTLRAVERDLAIEQRALDALRRDQRDARRKLANERGELARQVRAAYATGREGKLKLLLNQQDPARVQRALAYYDYFNAARGARIAEVQATLAKLAELEREIAARVAVLDAKRDERARTVAELDATRAARRTLVRELDAGIRDRKQRLARLGEEARRLARLIDSLSDVFRDIPADAGERRPFGQLRGRLPWPTRGRVLANYGQPRAEGKLRWEGLLIGAEAGAEVRAVARGRVAYADWLPHYGLMVIVEHGDGYLSLYGHNQALLKRAGDWVERGEAIAAIGDSGGQQRSALYFEIRQGTQPLDPRKWIARR